MTLQQTAAMVAGEIVRRICGQSEQIENTLDSVSLTCGCDLRLPLPATRFKGCPTGLGWSKTKVD
jgi:hypothetical protein